MLNVIKSELYKTSRRPYPYVVTGVCCLLALAYVVIAALANRGLELSKQLRFESVVFLIIPLLSIGVYFALMAVDIVFSEEYKHLTLRNTLSFGLPRPRVYLGKLLAEFLVALAMLAVILLVALGSGLMLLSPGELSPGAAIGDLLLRVVAALPLWFGALAISNLLAFTIRSNTLFALIFVGLFAALPTFLQLLGSYLWSPLLFVHRWLITTQFSLVQEATIAGPQILTCYLVGLGYALVATVAGIALFSRREIR